MVAKCSVVTATIAANGTLSASVDITGGGNVVGIVMPAGWTGAVVTLQGSPLGTTFYDLYTGTPGTELAFNVKPGTMVSISPDRLRCCAAVKLRSGNTASPVPQAAARQFGIIIELKPTTTLLPSEDETEGEE